MQAPFTHCSAGQAVVPFAQTRQGTPSGGVFGQSAVVMHVGGGQLGWITSQVPFTQAALAQAGAPFGQLTQSCGATHSLSIVQAGGGDGQGGKLITHMPLTIVAVAHEELPSAHCLQIAGTAQPMPTPPSTSIGPPSGAGSGGGGTGQAGGTILQAPLMHLSA